MDTVVDTGGTVADLVIEDDSGVLRVAAAARGVEMRDFLARGEILVHIVAPVVEAGRRHVGLLELA